MVATGLAKVAADPLGVKRRMDRLVARRTRRHETVVAALKETALRSTVRLSAGLPVYVSIVYFIYHFLFIPLKSEHFGIKHFIYTYIRINIIILAKCKNAIILLINT